MNITAATDLNRIKANSLLKPARKIELGQFYTPAPICSFMASLFKKISGDVRLLDPGCGVGSLFAAFADNAFKTAKIKSLEIKAFDIESIVEPFVADTFALCRKVAIEKGIPFKASLIKEDFILNSANILHNAKTLFGKGQSIDGFTHVIMNPPYKKINTASEYRNVLSNIGIETVNLYSSFVALAIQLLRPGGELVAIIPRSFCNGPYYQAFRKILLTETYIRHIHIFDERNNAFDEDDVLQENIIIHCEKAGKPDKIKITSSPCADFDYDAESKEYVASDTTIRNVNLKSVVNPNDKHFFIHIAPTEREQEIIDRLACFTTTIKELGFEVSTGPVVDFRVSAHLRNKGEKGAVPLLYPINLNSVIEWPKESKKANWITVNEETVSSLWKNTGAYIITKRFSSKEEKRRIQASLYNSELPFEWIGFENKLNVFHDKKKGIDLEIAKGLYIYLNCTLLDKYYRHFGGHTQVNASDLRSIQYPNFKSLKRIGEKVGILSLKQSEIDELINDEINLMVGQAANNPLINHEKIEEALAVLKDLGFPRAQLNERSALTLLALLDLEPNFSWHDAKCPLLGVTPIMDWCKEKYKKEYAPNTRETFRRQTLHQFIDGGILAYNPDNPARPVNSPNACYQVVPEAHKVFLSYVTQEYEKNIADFLVNKQTLVQKYAKIHEVRKIPLQIEKDLEIKLSAGTHSQLIKDIIVEFGPRFAPNAEVIYIGDTGDKHGHFKTERLKEIGIEIDNHGKMPDVILYDGEQKWLYLIESVTSHGPVDGKRHEELTKLFKNALAGLVFVTAFPDRKTMTKYLPDISWDTEVWIADAPTHMIHFNGDRFLGPHD